MTHTKQYFSTPNILVDDDDDDEEEDEKKNCSNIFQNLLYWSLSYTSTYIGTPKFLTKVLWVYNHLKSDFFVEEKVTKCDVALHQFIKNHLKVAQRRIMTCPTIF